jgi:hypothetical protein
MSAGEEGHEEGGGDDDAAASSRAKQDMRLGGSVICRYFYYSMPCGYSADWDGLCLQGKVARETNRRPRLLTTTNRREGPTAQNYSHACPSALEKRMGQTLTCVCSFGFSLSFFFKLAGVASKGYLVRKACCLSGCVRSCQSSPGPRLSFKSSLIMGWGAT